ncbi:tetratricopeptide repeat protein [Flavobacterium sp.]|uniref:tetratricopeptide repeat protein n=1 Tax=Flavobacterium sp. TaxID=239 RepID=UPI004034ACFD
MIRAHRIVIFIYIFFTSFFGLSQSNGIGAKTLEQLVVENHGLLMKDPDKAFYDIDDLLDRAKKEGDKRSELLLLSRRCWYLTNNDLKKAIDATKKLQLKAEEYKDLHFTATAHNHFSNIYLNSGLPKKALEEFEAVMEDMGKAGYKASKHDDCILRTNAYSAAGSAYRELNKPREAAKMILKANEDIKQLEDSEYKRLLLRINYSNLGEIYSRVDIDSAENFVHQAIKLSQEKDSTDIIHFNTSMILGYINKEKKQYAEAISHYKTAESKISYFNPSRESINSIYVNLYEIYKATDSLEQANHYLEKSQSSLLEEEQNKNRSLHKIIDDKLLEEKNYTVYVGIASAIMLLISLGIILRLYLRNRLLEKQERADEAYLRVNQPAKVQDIDAYKRLAELARTDDQAFIIAFHDQFPGFYEKLLEINPKLVESEIKFCAFLKLKLSTKEIAQVQNIEPATVKNKKNRIRKRLTIPADVELYYFFNQL